MLRPEELLKRRELGQGALTPVVEVLEVSGTLLCEASSCPTFLSTPLGLPSARQSRARASGGCAGPTPYRTKRTWAARLQHSLEALLSFLWGVSPPLTSTFFLAWRAHCAPKQPGVCGRLRGSATLLEQLEPRLQKLPQAPSPDSTTPKSDTPGTHAHKCRRLHKLELKWLRLSIFVNFEPHRRPRAGPEQPQRRPKRRQGATRSRQDPPEHYPREPQGHPGATYEGSKGTQKLLTRAPRAPSCYSRGL